MFFTIRNHQLFLNYAACGLQEERNKISIPEPEELFFSSTTPQHLAVVRIEDYWLKERNGQC